MSGSQVLGPVGLRRIYWRRRTTCSIAIFLLGASLWTSSETAPLPGLYEIDTQVLMPNLEENLRYADTQVRRCIRRNTVSDLFPVLQYTLLNGCTLAAGKQRGDTVIYSLVCKGSNGTTGTARLQSQANAVDGTLKIKMGGKNMTFSQRIEAMRQGECGSQS
jgi:hypothetical protein